MKKRGFSLVEIMVVTVVALGLLGIISGVFITGRNSWSRSSVLIDLQAKTRLAMDRMVRELSSSTPTQVTIDDCGDGVCHRISFRVPVATGEPPSIYDANGDIKWGAEGTEGWKIQYFALPDHRLVRIVPEDMPTGACCRDVTCYETTRLECEDMYGDDYIGNGTSCVDNPCAPLGACCYSGGSCSQRTQANCTGTWQGAGSSCTSCGSCFLAGTPILLANGTTKPIEEIKIGDEALAYDEKTKTFIKDKVSKIFEHKSSAYLIINNHFRITPNHPVYSNGEWIEIGKLKIGDSLFTAKGKPEPITDIKKINKEITTYNLELNPYHTYIADGYVVHNKVGGGDLPIGGADFGFLKNIPFESIAFAQENIKILATDIQELNFVGTPAANPHTVRITIKAQKISILGEPIEVELSSTVSFRNKSD